MNRPKTLTYRMLAAFVAVLAAIAFIVFSSQPGSKSGEAAEDSEAGVLTPYVGQGEENVGLADSRDSRDSSARVAPTSARQLGASAQGRSTQPSPALQTNDGAHDRLTVPALIQATDRTSEVSRDPEIALESESPEPYDSDFSDHYTDPVNKAALGNPAWMAQLPPEEEAAIDDFLDRGARRNQEIREREEAFIEDRRVSQQAAATVVNHCFEDLLDYEPAAQGRVMVTFDLHAHNGVGRMLNPQIPANVDLKDDFFEYCILTGLEAISIPVRSQGTFFIEFPFFFDYLSH